MPQNPPASGQDIQRRALTLDVEKYQAMLDAPDVTEAQQRKFLEALWTLITILVDFGYQIESADPAEKSCGLLANPALHQSLRATVMVELSDLNKPANAANGEE